MLNPIRCRTPWILTAVLCALAPAGASATVLRLSTEDLLQRSYAVVHADVVETRSAWGDWIHGGRVVYTTALIQVRSTIYGEAPSIIEVTVLGGEVPEGRMLVSDSPTLEPGEDVVLFLMNADGNSWITGLDNGKYNVANGRLVNSGHQTARSLSMDEFAREVQDAVKRLNLDR